ncbi:MAG: neutral zinc metallopeptidase [Candidatus Andeanibacterium colombiense]|uniref:Neutral zinc metallopeptidase n=1 Tax=Candidatus Andeanibacterium colombiense TaxID=3121345 RepID=A0AAJ6BQ72_9SPHN|nr:MAG: neutral zinc metallopeptidase [Sphingomonadaceae bacterium]
MRLNDFNPANIRVRDQRGGGGGMPGGKGSIGCVGLLVVLGIAYFTGADPSQLLSGLDQAQVSAPQEQAAGGRTAAESCAENEYSTEACAHLDSLNKTWEPKFKAEGIAFEQPFLNFYSSQGQSGCGVAQSAMGPFYCPSDEGIYIDTAFYDEMAQRMSAKGDFARAYVIAHEYGHHVQNLTGIAAQVRRMQQQDPSQDNALQVRMELQADCYAGVWAALNKDRIEAGDLEEGLTAAHAVGDDTLMEQAGRKPVEAAFTHGSSAQRMKWLRIGMETGDEDKCDTFADLKN